MLRHGHLSNIKIKPELRVKLPLIRCNGNYPGLKKRPSEGSESLLKKNGLEPAIKLQLKTDQRKTSKTHGKVM